MAESNSPTFSATAYVEEASQLLGLAIASDHQPGVIENVEALYTVAQLVMSLPLPKTIEAAPVFNPLPAGDDLER